MQFKPMTAKRETPEGLDPTETRILIDTSVWLDVAKDYRQQTLLSALEELTKRGIVVLLVPDIVREEFARNKARIIEDMAPPTLRKKKRGGGRAPRAGDTAR